MDLQSVIVNINYFIETVLNAANTDHRWNLESFEHALHWASFCERVVKDARTKNLNMLLQLNHCLQEILRARPDSFIVEANVGLLYHSKQVLLIVLLSNTKLPLQVFLKTVDIYEQHKKDHKQVLPHICKIPCPKLSATLAKCHKASNLDDWDCWGGALLLRYLGSNRKEHLDDKTLFLLVANKQRLHLLLCAISLRETEMSVQARDVQTFVNNWLCRRLLDKSNPVIAELWSQPAQVLVALAGRHQTFLQMYSQRLFEAGQDLRPSYSDFTYSWKNRGNQLHNKMDFEDLTIHFKLLLKVEGKVSELIKEEILGRTLQDGGSLWDDLIIACS